MTKLDEAIKVVDSNPYDPYDSTVLAAARSYAALLKLAPEIGALVKRLNSDIDYLDETYSESKTPKEYRSVDYEFCNLDLTLGDLKFMQTTLKAIHDNLTKWSE